MASRLSHGHHTEFEENDTTGNSTAETPSECIWIYNEGERHHRSPSDLILSKSADAEYAQNLLNNPDHFFKDSMRVTKGHFTALSSGT
ncbi:hypothetical protein E4U49_006496 [Claviceps purpurea]|nr:hypothetical protein E4U49_006496 [Claviceps purpurea]KAG6307326.1 hypothetical protein E4U45_005094 [Claviceps purpurea]